MPGWHLHYMDDVGMGPYEGSNFTAENVTELAEELEEDGQASSIFAWVVISLFILLNLAAICFLLWHKASEFIYSIQFRINKLNTASDLLLEN